VSGVLAIASLTPINWVTLFLILPWLIWASWLIYRAEKA